MNTKTNRLGKPSHLPESAEAEKAHQLLQRKINELQQAYQEMEYRNHRLQSQLFKAQEDLAAIINSVADALLVTDLKGQIVEFNPEAEELFEIERRLAAGRHFRSVLNNPQLAEAIDLALEAPRTGDSFEFGERRLGQDKAYQASMSPLCGRSGKPRGLVVLIRDISRLQELDRMKSEFLSTAAHKLRAPMTSIVGFSEILLTRPRLSKREREGYLQLIYDGSRQLSDLIDDLLDVSRTESEQGLSLELKQVRIEDLLRTETVGIGACQASHRVSLILPDALPPITCDPLRVRQVIRHLLSNAIKYSPEGGEIRVAAAAEDGLMRVSITDQGIGMSPDQISHAFDRFYRADGSNTAVEGAGLGLSIAKTIVNLHNGEIDIESSLNNGTTIEFHLPIEKKQRQRVQPYKEPLEV